MYSSISSGAVSMGRIIEFGVKLLLWQLWNFWPGFRCQGTETKARRADGEMKLQVSSECESASGSLHWMNAIPVGDGRRGGGRERGEGNHRISVMPRSLFYKSESHRYCGLLDHIQFWLYFNNKCAQGLTYVSKNMWKMEASKMDLNHIGTYCWILK